MNTPRVVAVLATYKRPLELGRLLDSLEKSIVPLHGVVITDNAGDAATAACAAKSSLPHRVLVPGDNLGCGGGLRLAEEEAFRAYPDLTHLLVLDDDVVLEPTTIARLAEAMETHRAGTAVPMPLHATGQPGWPPGLVDRRKFNILKNAATAADYLDRCGPGPEPVTWATGITVLISRETFTRAGGHREDFWVRGEDLDFALRLSNTAPAIFVPSVSVAHLPPDTGTPSHTFAERMKHLAMLQNCAFLAVRTRHGRVILKNWPGNVWRYLKTWGFWRVGDILRAGWLGAVRGYPAGVPKGDYFRRRLFKK